MGIKKVGIMGGTFDPIHIAHLQLAECAYEQYGLDEIRFIPAKYPPHKRDRQVLSESIRASMVKIAIAPNPHFTCSDIELNRVGYSYTSDTLSDLAAMEPNSRFYFIVGADSLNYMEEWHHPEEIFERAVILCANRDELPRERIDGKASFLREKFGADIRLIDLPALDISSHMIRDAVASGRSIRYYVTESVYDYITKHHLYRETR